MSVFLLGILMASFMTAGVFADDEALEADIAVNADLSAGLSAEEVESASADDDIESSSGIFGDKVRAAFTANAEKRAEIKSRIAAKRMYRLKEVVKEHPEKAKELAREYEEELDRALEDFEKIASDGNKEEVIRALKRTVIIEHRLKSHQAKWSEIHSNILEVKADSMTEEQLTHLEEVFSTTETKIEEKIDRIEQLQENLIARAVVVTGLTEEEVEAKLEAFENSLKDKAHAREARLESIKAKIDEDRERIRAKLDNSGKSRFGERIEIEKREGEIEIETPDVKMKVSGEAVEAIDLN